MAKLDWERARQLDRLGRTPPRPRPKPKRPGITNDQARQLAALRRRQCLPYDGRGMTKKQAARAIKLATAQLATLQTPPGQRPHRAQSTQARLRAEFRARQERDM